MSPHSPRSGTTESFRSSPPGTPSSSSAFSAVSLLSRLARDAALKALGTTLGMAAFFAAYFTLLRHPLSPPTLVPLTALDSFIHFHPLALIPYVALWPYIALLPALLIDRRELAGFALGCVGLAVTGLAIFLVWPTIIPAPDIDWSLHPTVGLLKSADAAGNACPSLHAAFAVFAGLWFARLLPRLSRINSVGGGVAEQDGEPISVVNDQGIPGGYFAGNETRKSAVRSPRYDPPTKLIRLSAGLILQAANILLSALIVFSTLATKQHVALDALFGTLLGAWAAGLNFIATPAGEDAPVHRRSLFFTAAVIKLCAVLLWYSGLPFDFCLALFLTGGGFVLFQLFAHGSSELLRVRTRFVPSTAGAREVWLTLDDGPDPDDTPRILDLLDQHRARATFFLIGEHAALHPELVSAIRLRGHEVAHHTQTHSCASFWFAPPNRLRHELDATLAILGDTGSAPRRFRPPVGFKNIFLGPALAACGLTCISWSLRSGDSFAHDAAAVLARIARRLRPGAIILLHEGPPRPATIRVHALASVLQHLTEQRYRCVIPPDTALR